jgi:hypothetical protein
MAKITRYEILLWATYPAFLLRPPFDPSIRVNRPTFFIDIHTLRSFLRITDQDYQKRNTIRKIIGL